MFLYTPNIKAFSPIWVWHNDSYNKTFRTGIWAAGETMFWGEELALAGSKILQIIDPNTKTNEIKIISNYGRVWPNNPGFKICPLTRQNLSFDNNTYYVLNKFMLFRDEIPPFIGKEPPLLTLSYKGEIGAWIYNGEQLSLYQEYLLKKIKK
jgi:hypothetical protein